MYLPKLMINYLFDNIMTKIKRCGYCGTVVKRNFSIRSRRRKQYVTLPISLCPALKEFVTPSDSKIKINWLITMKCRGIQ